MKKNEYLETSTRVSQLEARLNLNPYLSKTSLPTGVDAKVFLSLVAQRKIPNRQIHPNLYHWYILMKQFSTRTLEIWEQDSSFTDDDRLISEYIQSETSAAPRDVSGSSQVTDKGMTLKQKKSNGSADERRKSEQSSKNNLNMNTEEMSGGPLSKKSNSNDANLKSVLTQATSGCAEGQKVDNSETKLVVECVMEMKLKNEEATPMQEFKERLEEQKLKLVSLEGKQEKIRVVFKTEPQEIENLKDRISLWQEVDNIQFRKEKKLSSRGDGRSEKPISPEKN